MKTIAQLKKKVNELIALNQKLKSENPDLLSGKYQISNVPLKVMLEAEVALSEKVEYSKYDNRMKFRFYEFQPLGIDLTITSVLVEKITPEPTPVVAEYKEIKEGKLEKINNIYPF